MFCRYYKVELVRRAFHEHSLADAIGLGWRMVRGSVMGPRRVVFAMDVPVAQEVKPVAIPNFELQGLTGWSVVRQGLYEPLAHERRHLPDEPESFCAHGACFWVGRLQSSIVAMGLSRAGAGAAPYFLPLDSSEALLSHFVTLPAFRGRGLYYAMLTQIIHNLMAAGTSRFLIDCSDWNTSSLSAIERVGFRVIGHGIVKRRGRLVWRPLKQTAALTPALVSPGSVAATGAVLQSHAGRPGFDGSSAGAGHGAPGVQARRSAADYRGTRP